MAGPPSHTLTCFGVVSSYVYEHRKDRSCGTFPTSLSPGGKDPECEESPGKTCPKPSWVKERPSSFEISLVIVKRERPTSQNGFWSCIPERILALYYLAINISLSEVASGKKETVTGRSKATKRRECGLHPSLSALPEPLH